MTTRSSGLARHRQGYDLAQKYNPHSLSREPQSRAAVLTCHFGARRRIHCRFRTPGGGSRSKPSDSSRDFPLMANIVTFLPTIVALRRWALQHKLAREALINGLVDFMMRGVGSPPSNGTSLCRNESSDAAHPHHVRFPLDIDQIADLPEGPQSAITIAVIRSSRTARCRNASSWKFLRFAPARFAPRTDSFRRQRGLWFRRFAVQRGRRGLSRCPRGSSTCRSGRSLRHG
jgi:hypothetical protein